MNVRAVHLIFRIACAMCFIGHGAFGFITKKVWCNYFAVFGIGEQLAYKLMPFVGAMDVGLGLILLIYPFRFAAAWLVFWGLFTATLRPLSGEYFAELIERAGNFGAPFILLMLSAPAISGTRAFQRLTPNDDLTKDQTLNTLRLLQVLGFLLLLGHGWLNLLGKPGLLQQYTNLGIADARQAATIIGIIECAGAISVLFKPLRSIVLILLFWKVASEILYPAYPIIEWVERGGSYAVLLGIWMILKESFQTSHPFSYFSMRNKPESV